MLFVPLPVFATLLLILLLVRFVISRDMAIRAHQVFAALLALYAVQSLLISLRWGYGVEGVAVVVAVLAPVLPACAYQAYRALGGGWPLWPLGVVVANWVILAAVPDLADPAILLTYIGFGWLLLRLCFRGRIIWRCPLSVTGAAL